MGKIVVDIWGCCVSRDIISFNKTDFEVNNYFFSCSPVVAFSDEKLPILTENDFFSHNIGRSGIKSIVADTDNTLLNTLLNSSSEWVILDLRVLLYPIFKLTLNNNTAGHMTAKTIKNFDIEKIADMYRDKGYSCNITKINYDEIDIDEYLINMANFLKSKYGEKIILVNVREAIDFITKNGDIKEIDCNQVNFNPYWTAYEESFDLKFIKLTGCYYIKIPQNILADEYHLGDLGPVHYIDEYYKYAYESLLEITSNHEKKSKEEICLHLDLLYLKLSLTVSEIRHKKRLSARNSICIAKECLSKGKKEEAFLIFRKLIKQDVAEAYGELARVYFYGIGVPKNLNRAAKWMRLANKKKVYWAKNELFDILWRIGTPEALEEMIGVANAFAAEGDGGAMGRLGRAYREGRGVEKDLDKAAEWMRKAADKNIPWARNELELINFKVCSDSHKDIIVYDVAHIGFLNNAIALRYIRHPNDYSVLMIIDKPSMKETVKRFRSLKIFDVVIEYTPWHGHLSNTESETEKFIDKYYKEKLGPLFEDMSRFKVYAGGDLYYGFEIFLSMHEIKYTLVEIAKNEFASRSRIDAISRLGMSTVAFNNVQTKYGIVDGSGKYVEHVILDEDSSQDSLKYINCTYEYINLNEFILSIPQQYKDLLKKAFPLNAESDVQVMLLNSIGNTKYRTGLPKESYNVVYKALLDFYGDPSIRTLIKSHPDDSIDVNSITPNGIPMDGRPIELVAFFNDIHIKRLIAINTSSAHKLKSLGLVENVVMAGDQYYTQFKKLPIYKYISDIFLDTEYSITADNKINSFLKEYWSVNYPSMNNKNRFFKLIDTYESSDNVVITSKLKPNELESLTNSNLGYIIIKCTITGSDIFKNTELTILSSDNSILDKLDVDYKHHFHTLNVDFTAIPIKFQPHR